MKHLCLFMLMLLVASVAPAAAAAADARAHMPEQHRGLLKEHCQKCHGPDTQEGRVRLDDLPLSIDSVETAERWQKVLAVLNAGEMPPKDEPQPDPKIKTDFLADLSHAMVVARKSLSDQHGAITMRRLNRREYANTLKSLLGVEINVSELPSDAGPGGFDTVGSNLFMSANQFDQYRGLGREALEEAFARQAGVGGTEKVRIEGEEFSTQLKKEESDAVDAERRAKEWIAKVDEAAARPENAEIVATLKKESKTDAEFRRSWPKIAGAPPPEDYGFKTVENNADKANRAAGHTTDYHAPYRERYFAMPALDTGTYLTIQTLSEQLTYMAPWNWPPGEFIVRVRAAALPDSSPDRRFIEFGIDPRGGKGLHTSEVTGTMEAPQVIEFPLTLSRATDNYDTRAKRTLFVREKGIKDHYLLTRQKFNVAKARNKIGPELVLWVDYLEIERAPTADRQTPPGIAALGMPLDDKSPEPSASDLRTGVERFAAEAFRGGPVPPAFVDKLVGIYDLRRKAGNKHAAALKETLSLVLASPGFLYLAEPSDDATRRPLTGPELAMRLSYFLWGSPPDEALRELGRTGELTKPAVLAAQTDRLLDDPRSAGFIRPFIHQWLVLDRLDFFEFNRDRYPRFDHATKQSARNEVYETFAHLVRGNGSLTDLLQSDYVIIDDVLADYYGLPHPDGPGFQKVSLPKDSPRGGMLGMAAVLAMGSNGDTTSPVERGAWVLRKMLDDPPPPPPANVPSSTRLAGKTLTPRERLKMHQEEPQCASCHRSIDPLGFGLENFDAVGQWRTEDSYQAINAEGKPDPKQPKKTWAVDPAAEFYGGQAFKDFPEMRAIIASEQEAFARGFTKSLIEYALGRPCGFSDEPLVDSLVKQSAAKGYGARESIQALVASEEFSTK
jgi:mono/diheme cytochrome c family protein